MDTKHILMSKTVWVNILTIVFVLANRLWMPIPIELLEPIVVLTLPLVNVALRKITSKGTHV